METLIQARKQFLEECRTKLDDKFSRDYPMGKFSLQTIKNKFIALHWMPKRKTCQNTPRGISTYYFNCEEGISQENFQRSSNNTINYKKIEDLIKATERKGIPQKLVTTFLFRYHNRAKEGFAI